MRDRAGLANSTARMKSAAKGGRVSDDALSQAFEFAAEFAGGVGHAGDAAIEHVEDDRDAALEVLG